MIKTQNFIVKFVAKLPEWRGQLPLHSNYITTLYDIICKVKNDSMCIEQGNHKYDYLVLEYCLNLRTMVF